MNPSASGVARSDEGVVFQRGRDRWIRGLLARNPCAIGIQPVHTRVDSCGLRGLPPKGDSTESNFALGLHLPPQHRLVDAQYGRAVVRAPAHALGEALEVVGGRTLLQRDTQLVAELEGEMQVLVGEVEGERGR